MSEPSPSDPSPSDPSPSGEVPSRGSSPAVLVALLSLFVVSLGARLSGLEYLLPSSPEPDKALVRQARMFRGDLPIQEPTYSNYPHLLGRILALVPMEEPPSGAPDEDRLEEHLRVASQEIRAVRLLVAVLASLAIPLTWLLARRFFGPWWSLFTAASVASSLLHVMFSLQARPHGASSTLSLLAIVCCLYLVSRGTLLAHFVAGAGCALAVCSLHTGVFVLPALLVAHWLAPRPDGRWRPLRLLAAALPLAAGGLAFYPFVYRTVPEQFTRELDIGQVGLPHPVVWDWSGQGFVDIVVSFADQDPLLVLLAIAGLAVGLLRLVRGHGFPSRGLRNAVLVVLGHALPFILVIGVYQHVHQRFLMPLLPYVALLATLAVSSLAGVLFRRQQSALASAALAVAVLVPPTVLAGKLVLLRTRPDTIDQAVTWIREHVEREQDTIAVSPWLSLPLFYPIPGRDEFDPTTSRIKDVWYFYQTQLPPAEGAPFRYRILPVGFGLRIPATMSQHRKSLEMYDEILDLIDGDLALVRVSPPLSDVLTERLLERGERLWRVAPYEGADPKELIRFPYQGPGIWKHVWRAQRLGPVIECIRLR